MMRILRVDNYAYEKLEVKIGVFKTRGVRDACSGECGEVMELPACKRSNNGFDELVLVGTSWY